MLMTVNDVTGETVSLDLIVAPTFFTGFFVDLLLLLCILLFKFNFYIIGLYKINHKQLEKNKP
jgi:hypothetical protein